MEDNHASWSATEGEHVLEDGLKLYCKTWKVGLLVDQLSTLLVPS